MKQSFRGFRQSLSGCPHPAAAGKQGKDACPRDPPRQGQRMHQVAAAAVAAPRRQQRCRRGPRAAKKSRQAVTRRRRLRPAHHPALDRGACGSRRGRGCLGQGASWGRRGGLRRPPHRLAATAILSPPGSPLAGSPARRAAGRMAADKVAAAAAGGADKGWQQRRSWRRRRRRRPVGLVEEL